MHYRLKTMGEKLVIDYTGLNLLDIQEMPIDIYLFFLREAVIYENMKTEDGREYLENCWRMEQTEPERGKLRVECRKG